MSHLKLYAPVAGDAVDYPQGNDGEPLILSFTPRRGARLHNHVMDVIERSRILHRNRCCPNCNHPVVEPIELDDAVMSRNHLPIPGTATLVGFHCQACSCEWPIDAA